MRQQVYLYSTYYYIFISSIYRDTAKEQWRHSAIQKRTRRCCHPTCHLVAETRCWRGESGGTFGKRGVFENRKVPPLIVHFLPFPHSNVAFFPFSRFVLQSKVVADRLVLLAPTPAPRIVATFSGARSLRRAQKRGPPTPQRGRRPSDYSAVGAAAGAAGAAAGFRGRGGRDATASNAALRASPSTLGPRTPAR